MKGEGERRKEHNYCFLWQFMAFFHFFSSTSKQTNLRFLFSDERIFFPFVSLIDFRNNSSHFAYIENERKKRGELMNFLVLRRGDYGQEK